MNTPFETNVLCFAERSVRNLLFETYKKHGVLCTRRTIDRQTFFGEDGYCYAVDCVFVHEKFKNFPGLSEYVKKYEAAYEEFQELMKSKEAREGHHFGVSSGQELGAGNGPIYVQCRFGELGDFPKGDTRYSFLVYDKPEAAFPEYANDYNISVNPDKMNSIPCLEIKR